MAPVRHYTRIVTPPAIEPLDLPLAKAWLREDGDDQDAIIRELIGTAREEVENYTGRATVSTVYCDSLDAFPGCGLFGGSALLDAPLQGPWLTPRTSSYAIDQAIVLLRSPVISVVSVRYYDATNTLQTMSAENYIVDNTMDPGRVAPAPGRCWPAAIDRPGAVLITYSAGYATREVMPKVMKQAMRMLVAGWYENRESITDRTTSELPMAVRYLLDRVAVFY